ncbi:MAG: hypothetical protein WAU91_10900 [Desulfatitalea sp.]
MNEINRVGMPFKICPKCGTQWSTREELLSDPEVALVGYQANFKALKAGILLFNHICKTTLALYATGFQDLYAGPVFAERATGGSDCPGHCLRECDLEPCPARCECAYVRHILQLIKAWPKTQTSSQ